MMKLRPQLGRRLSFALLLSACAASLADAQTSINGSSLAFRSSGAASGSDWTLSSNGYVGTYVTLSAPGTVNFTVNASGTAGAGVAPRLSLAVNDSLSSFDVASGFNGYVQSLSLPAGTHFVRVQYDNDSSSAASRSLTVRNLQVTGATVSNSASNTNALAAANTYIQNYRRGNVQVSVAGPGGIPLLPGTTVRAKLARNAFNFGGTVPGFSLNDPTDVLASSNPAPGTDAQKYQDFARNNFNTLVGENAGKWAYNEAVRTSVNMSLPDRQLNWAIANNKRSRMHTLLWGSGTSSGSQQPNWVNSLISQAAAGNATAKANLRAAISSRIQYYAGTVGNRSQKFIEIDGLNESLHNPSYLNIFGVAGVAEIYEELNAAIAAAGSSARTYVNEWNVLQYAPASVNSSGVGSGNDPYANYYRQHVDDLQAAGADLGGIGIQYYANYTQTGSTAHSAATIQKALGNLSVANLPISMAEFGGGATMTSAENVAGATVLEETLRMFYGTPNATTFIVWNWWGTSGSSFPPAALLDNSLGNAVVTPMGLRWQQLMSEFTTDVTPTVAADGSIRFNGHWGDYNIGNQSLFSNLTIQKGTSNYAVELLAPPTWSFWTPANSGDWSGTGNWTSGVATGAGATAHFASAAGARTVMLDTNRTVGQMNFDSAASYRIDGPATLTLEGLADVAALNVVNGTHHIDAPVLFAHDTTAWVKLAGSTLTLSHLEAAPTATLTKTGEGTLVVGGLALRGIDIQSGQVVLQTDTTPSTLTTLSIASGATLDLDGRLVLSGTDAGTLQTHLLAGRLTSSRLISDARLGIGIVADSISSATVAVVLLGDHNLSGGVDFNDLLILARNYSAPGTQGWGDGDTNYDGSVNFNDLLAVARNYNQSMLDASLGTWTGTPFASDWALAQSLVPEPLTMSGLLATCLTRRRVR